MYQSEGTGRERKGEISQRRKQNEIIIITILAVIMTAVMFANILENPKISDQSANEKEKMEKAPAPAGELAGVPGPGGGRAADPAVLPV